MRTPIKTIVSVAVAGIMANHSAIAGGFSLYTEGSAAEIGNFAAGAAAEGADASIGYYNPAGLVLIHQQQAVFSGVGVFPSSKLSGTSTFVTTDVALPYEQTFSGLQGGKNALVPALHYAKPLGDRATFGFSVTSPFGLSTEYGQSSPVRYGATLTQLMTINASPQLGAQLNDNFAIGAGLDFQWARVKFNSVLGSPAFAEEILLNPRTFDTESYNEGHSFALGFHAGLLGMFNQNHTRLGLNYQSRMKHQFNGYSLLTGRFADPALTNPTATFRSNRLNSNAVSLPDMITFSAYQDLNDHWALLGSAIYAGWDSFKVIRLNNVAAYSALLGEQVLVNSTAIENYQNVWRFALGANYHINPQWMLKTGIGYDETPTINAQRDIRLPDANRWALSAGGHYQMRPAIGFDFGYTYLWADKDPVINKTTPLGSTSSYTVNAHAKVHAQLVGLQAVWTIDHDEK